MIEHPHQVKMSYEVFEFSSEKQKDAWLKSNCKSECENFYMFTKFDKAMEFARMMKHVAVLQHFTVSDLLHPLHYKEHK